MSICNHFISNKRESFILAKNKVKKPFYKRVWVWVLAIIIIIAISTGGNESDETASTDTGNDEGGQSREKDAAEVENAKIGETATIGDVGFTVNGVEETSEIDSGNEFIDNAQTDGKYVIIDIDVKNGKDESITINSSYFTLITGDGKEYEPNTDGTVTMAMGDAASGFFLEQINPDLNKSGKVIFETGEDVDINNATLQAQTGVFGTETIEISLSN